MQTNPVAADKTYWVVVADEAGAVVYGQDRRNGPLTTLFTLDNEAARLHVGDIITDRGGRSFDSHGQGRHTMVKEKTGPKRHIASVFARDIASRIGHALHDGSCRGYALIAAPRFLGVLRDALATTAGVEPFLSIDKDVVGRDIAFIEELLAGS